MCHRVGTSRSCWRMRITTAVTLRGDTSGSALPSTGSSTARESTTPGSLGERVQQSKLLLGQRQGTTVDVDQPARRIDQQPVVHDRGGASGGARVDAGVGHPLPAHQRMGARDQLAHLHRQRHVVVGPLLERRQRVAAPARVGEEERGHPFRGSIARIVRHAGTRRPHVHDGEIESIGREIACGIELPARVALVPFERQMETNRVTKPVVRFDDQDLQSHRMREVQAAGPLRCHALRRKRCGRVLQQQPACRRCKTPASSGTEGTEATESHRAAEKRRVARDSRRGPAQAARAPPCVSPLLRFSV